MWHESIDLTVLIHCILKTFPKEEKFGIISQISKASVSIPSNIAEGCRGSDKELIYFLNIALGSSYELETQLILSNKIGYLDHEHFEPILHQLHSLQKSINAFRSKVKY